MSDPAGAQILGAIMFCGAALNHKQMEMKETSGLDPFHIVAVLDQFTEDPDVRAAAVIYALLLDDVSVYVDHMPAYVNEQVMQLVLDVPLEHPLYYGVGYDRGEIEEGFAMLNACQAETITIVAAMAMADLLYVRDGMERDMAAFLAGMVENGVTKTQMIWYMDRLVSTLGEHETKIVLFLRGLWQELRPQIADLPHTM